MVFPCTTTTTLIKAAVLLLAVVAILSQRTAEAFTAPAIHRTHQQTVSSSSSSSSSSSPISPCSTLRRRLSTTAILVNGDAIADAAAETKITPPTPNIRLNVNEKARTVLSVCTSGTLCTTSTQLDGNPPTGSFVDYVLDDSGNPIFLMNDMSLHTVNAKTHPVVTLFCQLDGQDVGRCSVTGTLSKMKDNDDTMDIVRMRYSIQHIYADQVMDSPKFAFYRLTIEHIYFVGGFGVLAKWVDVQDYQNSTPDILALESATIVATTNRECQDDLLNVAKSLLLKSSTQEIQNVRVTAVDRLGMDMRVTCQSATRRTKTITDEFRIGFRIPVISLEDAKSEMLKIFQEAWETQNKMSWGDSDVLPGADIPIIKIAADGLE